MTSIGWSTLVFFTSIGYLVYGGTGMAVAGILWSIYSFWVAIKNA